MSLVLVMCGGALVVACTDCAEALPATARTSAADNAASFAFSISVLLPISGGIVCDVVVTTVQGERRSTRPDVNGRVEASAAEFFRFPKRSHVDVAAPVFLRLIDRND